MTVTGDTYVDIYVDVNGQWVSGDRGSQLTWEFYQEKYQKGRGLKTMTFRRDTEQLLTEINDRSEWGSFYFTAPLVSTSTILTLAPNVSRMFTTKSAHLRCSAIALPLLEH